jgi:type I restriction enzyme M protein
VAEACGSGQRRLSEDSSAGAELAGILSAFRADAAAFEKAAAAEQEAWREQDRCSEALHQAVERLAPLAEASRALGKQIEQLYKLAGSLAEGEEGGRRNGKIGGALKAADETRKTAAAQLRQVRYFWRQASWLMERFPEAKLRDVEGLVKLASIDEIAANDWSLTPGRYVGVAPEEEDGDFDFEEALREIHVELEDLNSEAARLAESIKRNFQELGI